MLELGWNIFLQTPVFQKKELSKTPQSCVGTYEGQGEGGFTYGHAQDRKLEEVLVVYLIVHSKSSPKRLVQIKKQFKEDFKMQ